MRTMSFYKLENLILIGYSGKDKDRKNINPKIKKTSLGSQKDIKVYLIDTSKDLVKYAKEKGLRIVCVEQNTKSNRFEKHNFFDNTIYVLGNELAGISKTLIKNCNEILEIKRHGNHYSLNVSIVAGILIHNLVNCD